MRSEEEYQKALQLIRDGLNDCEVGRRLGIPRTTIRDWREGVQARSGGRTKHWSGLKPHRPLLDICPVCSGSVLDEEANAYLLGMYLGDGCLSEHPRNVYRLRVFCDMKYPDIIDENANHMIIISGHEKVGLTSRSGCVEVSGYWKHWICLFPQHAPQRKHERRIQLQDWQSVIVENQPKALIRGLIQSDGSRHINEVTRLLRDGPKRYRYPRYMFTNASTDILGMYTDTLDQLGVHWTRTTARDISVARRADVEFLDTFVGPKS